MTNPNLKVRIIESAELLRAASWASRYYKKDLLVKRITGGINGQALLDCREWREAGQVNFAFVRLSRKYLEVVEGDWDAFYKATHKPKYELEEDEDNVENRTTHNSGQELQDRG